MPIPIPNSTPLLSQEVEEKPVAKARTAPVQELLPPLRQPIVAPQRRSHASASSTASSGGQTGGQAGGDSSAYDQWPCNNEILYRCVYPAPNRVVTDSTHVISPPLSLEQYLSMYTNDSEKLMPTYAYSQSSGV